MELTEENQDSMDCRPPTGRNTGIETPPRLQAMIDQRKAAKGSPEKGLLSKVERLAAE